MSRKHYEAAAADVRHELATGASVIYASYLASGYVRLFTQFNPQFDSARFYRACNLEAPR